MPKIPVDQRNCPKAEVFWTVSKALPYPFIGKLKENVSHDVRTG
ncbi:hypothetical protein HMPREF0860_0152 [Treponema socranskii subsp. socranskii VPI DR56BR1116 = ATCC 35536]|uniref:Uncharacterized protein n=1 Tax=Treponema socranskii subsp. socranskii VPI DR56BR1116 = ATCC 35536 TaxID=1125725 RepID=U1GYD4_TRESO|nr:hypothetical protein HMPREF1325_2399 [Treponema socranskii subsp. socranskii VPI DR56BR1116 = ATCC 35536]ERK02630.1 hypothetical protein HMPREF0860_0152 [Treponema socranskii subsp. socranskii VPI DR56BR1116 = ATCC 35536]